MSAGVEEVSALGEVEEGVRLVLARLDHRAGGLGVRRMWGTGGVRIRRRPDRGSGYRGVGGRGRAEGAGSRGMGRRGGARRHRTHAEAHGQRRGQPEGDGHHQQGSVTGPGTRVGTLRLDGGFAHGREGPIIRGRGRLVLVVSSPSSPPRQGYRSGRKPRCHTARAGRLAGEERWTSVPNLGTGEEFEEKIGISRHPIDRREPSHHSVNCWETEAPPETGEDRRERAERFGNDGRLVGTEGAVGDRHGGPGTDRVFLRALRFGACCRVVRHGSVQVRPGPP